MKWYAIRTLPGAQQPKREYWCEPSLSAQEGKPRGKGYRIASGLNPMMSAVELALEDAGITHYMPAEYTAVRNRHHAGLYEVRRFAMLKRWMFVWGPDWGRLLCAKGVSGIVSNNGVPIAINPVDLHRLRMFEANSRSEAEHKAKSLSTAGERLVREQRKTVVRGAKKKLFPGREVKLIWGDKTGREATVQGWQDQDYVQVILRTLEDAEEIVTVPFEFLKAS